MAIDLVNVPKYWLLSGNSLIKPLLIKKVGGRPKRIGLWKIKKLCKVPNFHRKEGK